MTYSNTGFLMVTFNFILVFLESSVTNAQYIVCYNVNLFDFDNNGQRINKKQTNIIHV